MGEEREVRPPRRGSIFWPVLLIVLGVVLLLGNIGILNRDTRETLINLWPVLLLVAGVDNLYRREGIVGATFLIGLGAIFLAANLGWLNVDVWRMVFSLWPVLLIAIGFDLILGRRSIWLSLVAFLLVLAILVGSLWLAGARISVGQSLLGEEIRQALPDNVTHARVVLQPGIGNVSLYSLEDSGNLIKGKALLGKSSPVYQDLSQEGDRAIFTLRSRGLSFYIGRDTWSWELGLNPALPLDLQFSLGAGNAELDLRALRLERLEVDMGVGKTTVTLPVAGRFEARVNGAISQIVIKVPSQMAIRLQAETALANINVPPGYRRDGKIYTSPGFETAENQVDLKVGMAIGNITLQAIP